jgi:hypothetical protein
MRKVVHLTYDLYPQAQGRYQQLTEILQTLGTCRGLWRIVGQSTNTNLKYHAGATHSVQRARATSRFGFPKGLEANVKITELGLGDQQLYFLPDRVLVHSAAAVGAIEYPEILCDARATAFIEDEAVPADAKVLRTTWRYTNRDGGPDKRFANNQQLPVVQYGEIGLRSTTGMDFLLQASSLDKALKFRQGLLDYAAGGTRRSEPAAPRPESRGKPHTADDGGSTSSRRDPERAAMIHKALEAIRAGNLSILKATAPMPLDEGETCHMELQGSVCATGNASTAQTGCLYITNQNIRFIGHTETMLPMKAVQSSMQQAGVVQVIATERASVLILSSGDPLVNELLTALITRLSSAAQEKSRRQTKASSTREEMPKRASQVLQVSSSASIEEITAAYHKLAQMYHPDKVAGLGSEFRDLAEQKMKEINAAYDELKRAAEA